MSLLRTRIALHLSAAALTLGSAWPVHAAPVVFSGLDNVSGGGTRALTDAARAAFTAAAGALATQGFEGFAAGPVPASFSVGTVGVAFTPLTPTGDTKLTVGPGGFTTYAAEGTHYIESLANPDRSFFSMRFDRSVSALGFYLSDLSDWNGQTATGLEIVLLRDNAPDETLALLIPGTAPIQMVDGNLAFFGFVDAAQPIRGFRIHDPSTNPGADAIGLDLLMLPGAAVPLPASGALLAAGLALLGATRRRG